MPIITLPDGSRREYPNSLSVMEVAADIFQVHDLDEIGRFGIVQTPALIINGDLKSAGRHPSRSQIEAWLREYISQE